ncbi:hypothetical protein [Nocardiopsis sp. CNR-923]|uniref:hypothetical protein n=1 Tax=Nocardiopsis sp. CNR-923 TaxID=1904965 RepID=UPI0013010826|nr:hypothetical protein [Nocardiopsis sp. CNR-923]
MAGLVIAAVGLIGVLVPLMTPTRHHLGSHEPSPCRPVVPSLLHPSDPLFDNERLTSWTTDQCAVARRERLTSVWVVAAPTVAAGTLGLGGPLVRRR